MTAYRKISNGSSSKSGKAKLCEDYIEEDATIRISHITSKHTTKNEYWINKVVLQEVAYAHVILLPVFSWVHRIEFL